MSSLELGQRFVLQEVLEYGTLPKVFSLQGVNKKRFLPAYAQTYLREDVWGEQFVRHLPPLRKFLEGAAQSQGQIVNYSKIARDVGVDHKTVKNYFSILEDTMLGLFLPAFEGSVRKQQRQAPKFYLFDNGVKRALDKTIDGPLLPHSYEYGIAFEHPIIREIMTRMSYAELDYSRSYLRTESGAEIDLIISRVGRLPILIEIKSGTSIKEEDLKHLRLLMGSIRHARTYWFCAEKHRRKQGAIHVVPWEEGIQEVLSGDI